MTRGKRIYVLDTNVLMHDPTALFKFEEHDIYLPMQVIEELDNGKKYTRDERREILRKAVLDTIAQLARMGLIDAKGKAA